MLEVIILKKYIKFMDFVIQPVYYINGAEMEIYPWKCNINALCRIESDSIVNRGAKLGKIQGGLEK